MTIDDSFRRRPEAADEDFQRLFAAKLKPEAEQIAGRRKKAFLKALLAGGLGFAVFALVGSLYLAPSLSLLESGFRALWPLMLLLPLSIAIVIVSFTYILLLRSVVNDFKCAIISRIAEFVDPAIVYDSKESIPERTFKRSLLFENTRYNRYSGEDYFRGAVGRTRFEFSELKVEEVRRTQDGKARYNVFSGIFFVAEFNKKFKGFTMAVPDFAETNFGWVGQKLQELNFTRPGQAVRLEDVEFEEMYAVYASDQVEARYILSPSLMRRLSELRRKHGVELYFSCVEDHIHIALPGKRKHFEPPGLFASLTLEHCREFCRDIRACIDIVEDLDLDTRLWDDGTA